MKKFLAIAAAAALCSGILQTKEAVAIPTQWAGNGHYYELISGSFTFGQALTQAGSMTHLGATGHLVTITSAGEQSFLNTLTGGSELYYIGASDSVTEGDWKWIVGPETGSSFWISGITQPGFYANWAGGEPNNGAGANEHVAVGNWSFNGSWNDLQGTQQLSYVVEYSIDVPEPGVLALLGIAVAGLGLARRKRAA
jgi:hypothetical protein